MPGVDEEVAVRRVPGGSYSAARARLRVEHDALRARRARASRSAAASRRPPIPRPRASRSTHQAPELRGRPPRTAAGRCRRRAVARPPRGARPRRRGRRAPPRRGTPCSSPNTRGAARARPALARVAGRRGPRSRVGPTRSAGCPRRARPCRVVALVDVLPLAVRRRSTRWSGRSARSRACRRSRGSVAEARVGQRLVLEEGARRRVGVVGVDAEERHPLAVLRGRVLEDRELARHGPHHDAHLFTTTGWPFSAATCFGTPSSSRRQRCSPGGRRRDGGGAPCRDFCIRRASACRAPCSGRPSG